MASTIANKIVTARDKLKAKRSTWITLCEDVCRYFGAEYQHLLRQTEGSEVIQPLVSTGILAQDRMVAGIFSNTMSMGRGQVVDEDSKKMGDPEVRRFYESLSNQTHRSIQVSPFPEKYHEMLRGAGLRGTGVMYVSFNRDTVQHQYLVYPAVQCFEVRDIDGNPIEMYREFELDAVKAVTEYGYENVSEEIQKAYDKHEYGKKFEFIHCMRPNRNRNKKRTNNQNMPYESIHVEVGKKKIVRKSGTRRFRYLCPRLEVKEGEDTGRSPAFKAMPSMRTIMKVVSDFLDGSEIASVPPLFLSDKDAVESAIIEGGAVNYADMSKGQPWIMNVSGNLELSLEVINWFREEIRQLHYVDLFAMLEDLKATRKTAYEISELVAERIQSISPLINRLSRGFFAPLYDIVAEDIVTSGLAEVPTPPQLLDSEFRVSYTNRLDVQLSELEITSLQQAFIQAAEMLMARSQVKELIATIDPLKLVYKIFEAKNVDVDLVRSMKEAKDAINQMDEAEAQALQMEQLKGAAKPIDLQKAGEEGSPASAMQDALDQSQIAAV
jgi:hypothetical protein